MECMKCRKEIPDGSPFCNHCGKKQIILKTKTHKRAHGTGTIIKDKRYHKQWIAYAPSDKHGKNRMYIGAYETRKDAQEALVKFMNEKRPELYNADLETIYRIWSDTHYQTVSESAVKLYTSMWKRFASIRYMKMRNIRTVHLQEIVNTGKSRSACNAIRTLACMLCRYAVENDIVVKNYAEFIKMPKFDKKEKSIFSHEEIEMLWKHADDKHVQIILVMLYTGLRIGEIVMLQPENIFLNEGYIVGGEKTDAGKNRIIPLPDIPEIKFFLQQWLEESVSETVLGLDVSKLRKYFYSALLKCGIQNDGNRLTPHSTRHTFASLSATAGIKPETLQRIIGHANYSTTAEIYIHKNLEELQSEMKKLKK